MQRIPLGRHGEHQELSNLAAYLLSDFSAYITGACVTIDGGTWLARGRAVQRPGRSHRRAVGRAAGHDEAQEEVVRLRDATYAPVAVDTIRRDRLDETPSVDLHSRCGHQRHHDDEGPAGAGHSVHDVRKERPDRRQLGVSQQERHVERLSLAAHRLVALLDRIRRLSVSPRTIPTFRTTRRSSPTFGPMRSTLGCTMRIRFNTGVQQADADCRRPLADHARNGRGPALRPRWSWPTATTGTPVGPSRLFPAISTAFRSIRTNTSTHSRRTTCTASGCWWSASAIARWTSPAS